jgi:protein tyrosine/serine phosphatase
MKKKKQKNLLTPRQIALVVICVVLVFAVYIYILFLKPITPDITYAAVRVPSAVADPEGAAVKEVLKSGKAVRLDLAGCPNLCRVSDTLYRGAQPTREGFENLKALGIKTVISLRDHHSDEDLLEGTGLTYISIATDTWDISHDKVAAFLRAAVDPAAAPVFVHCQHGADRTGVMVASYRVVVQGWEKKRAVREMTHGGFGYHPLWVELPDVVRSLDADALKTQIGQAQKQ